MFINEILLKKLITSNFSILPNCKRAIHLGVRFYLYNEKHNIIGVRRMKKTSKRVIIGLLIFGVLASGFIVKQRSDLRFIIVNSFNQSLMEKADLENKKIEEEKLLRVSIEDIKDDKDNIIYNNDLALINKENPVGDNFNQNLVEYKDSGVRMDQELVKPYEALSKAVKEKTGESLYIMSSFRTKEEQQEIFNQDNKLATIPGTSEHETGLALDIYVKHFAGYGFLKSDAGQLVNKDSFKYGFIIRYPAFKKQITGIAFEPWHIRYVGFPHAEIIYKNKLTLEEYIEKLEIGNFYEYDNYLISRQNGDNIKILDGLSNLVVSPDNMGNYIISGQIKDEK